MQPKKVIISNLTLNLNTIECQSPISNLYEEYIEGMNLENMQDHTKLMKLNHKIF
jgi:hypothetical protein